MSEQQQPKVRKPRHHDIPAARALSVALLPELRQITARSLETDSQDDCITVRGVPVVYDTPYSVRDAFGEFEERMAPGVAADVMNDPVVFQYDHEGMALARNLNTMTLTNGSDGLHFEARLDPANPHSQALISGISRGDISQMSVSFAVAKDHWDEDYTHRTISRFAAMYDISAVAHPASPSTSIEISKRMALRAPIESVARLVAMATEIRAGKVLSASNQAKLIDAFSSMHEVLGNSGFDLSSLFEAKEEEVPEEERQEEAPAVEPDTNEYDERKIDFALAQLEALRLRRRH